MEASSSNGGVVTNRDANALSFLLRFERVVQSALTGQASTSGKTCDELLLVEDGALLVEKTDTAASTKRTMTKLRTVMSKLMSERWRVFIHGGFEFGVAVFVLFFAKSTDAVLKRSTPTRMSR